MTIKQKRVLQVLPKNNYNVSKSMREAGYTEAGSKAGNNYEQLRRVIEREFKLSEVTPEYVIGGLRREAESAPNPSDRIRAMELLGKYLALFTDKSQISDVTTAQKQQTQTLLNDRLRELGITQ